MLSICKCRNPFTFHPLGSCLSVFTKSLWESSARVRCVAECFLLLCFQLVSTVNPPGDTPTWLTSFIFGCFIFAQTNTTFKRDALSTLQAGRALHVQTCQSFTFHRPLPRMETPREVTCCDWLVWRVPKRIPKTQTGLWGLHQCCA